MRSTRSRDRALGALAAAAFGTACMTASHSARCEMQVGADDIGGKVSSARGAEAGVWVIAETHDFQTRYAKIVVTDEAGRYLVPDLPSAKYSVWVRGYGLADSPRSTVRRASISISRRSSLRMRRRPPGFIPRRTGTR